MLLSTASEFLLGLYCKGNPRRVSCGNHFDKENIPNNQRANKREVFMVLAMEGAEGIGEKKTHEKRKKKSKCALFSLLLLLMLIPDGGLGKVFSLCCVCVSQVFYFVFSSVFFFVVVFPLHKKCAVQFFPLLSEAWSGGGVNVFVSRQVKTTHVKGFLSEFSEFDFQVLCSKL